MPLSQHRKVLVAQDNTPVQRRPEGCDTQLSGLLFVRTGSLRFLLRYDKVQIAKLFGHFVWAAFHDFLQREVHKPGSDEELLPIRYICDRTKIYLA